MLRAITVLGAQVEQFGAGQIRVVPPTQIAAGGVIDCGLAGTLMRFLPAVAALANGTTRFVGDEAASARPVAPLLTALGNLGAKASDARLPFAITGNGSISGGGLRLDSSASSQFISGLLLAAPRFQNGLQIAHVGKTLPSRPHVEMTLQMLRSSGVAAQQRAEYAWSVSPGPIRGLDMHIEPDLTNTATFLAVALATNGELTAPWPQFSVQPKDELLGSLRAFGAKTSLSTQNGQPVVTLSGRRGIRPASVDLGAISELTPVIAALAALAPGPSHIRGVAHIRGHETDRLAALETMLQTLGASVESSRDGLIIMPKQLHGGKVTSSGDHRMAHAAALIGLRVPGVLIEGISATKKTIPDFERRWSMAVGR
jgi:3-phosphoshikimate 1-carboxyvinyltransferase